MVIFDSYVNVYQRANHTLPRSLIFSGFTTSPCTMTPWVTPWLAKKETQPSKGQKRRRRRCDVFFASESDGAFSHIRGTLWKTYKKLWKITIELMGKSSLMGKITMFNGKKDKKKYKKRWKDPPSN